MQEIGGAIENLTLAAVTDKYVVTRLTEAVRLLTRNNTSLTAQLSNAMNMNLDMAKNPNLKPPQEPEDKIITEKSKRNAAFDKNIDPEGYCWTHRFRSTKRHSSQTCLAPAAGHQRAANQKEYIMGGRNSWK